MKFVGVLRQASAGHGQAKRKPSHRCVKPQNAKELRGKVRHSHEGEW